MSKDKIEVGDIWRHNRIRRNFVITNIRDEDSWYSVLWDNGFAEKINKLYHIDYYNTYIGKSKGKIKDLFETKEESK